MVEIVKELKGHSGASVSLIKEKGELLIRKSGDNVKRNLQRHTFLLHTHAYDLPKIKKIHSDTCYDMEYIHGYDMKSYLLYHDIDDLLEFLTNHIHKLKTSSSGIVDYSPHLYQMKLQLPKGVLRDMPDLLFMGEEGLHFPRTTNYHGDMTLENIIYDPMRRKFIFIDCVETPFDSYIFDVAKLRQDLYSKWFIRNEGFYNTSKLDKIHSELERIFPEAFSSETLIMMLLRVLRHCEIDDSNYRFLCKEINDLCLK